MTKEELRQKCRDMETAAFNMCLLLIRDDELTKRSGFKTLEEALVTTLVDAKQRKERMLREWEKNNHE